MIRQFYKNAGFLAAAEVVAKMKGFIFIPLLTRHFGAVNYGVWSQVGILVAMLSPILVLGTDSALTRYLPGRPLNEQKRFFSAWLILLTGISISVCSTVYIFKHKIALVFFGEADKYELFIPLAAVYLFITLLLNIFRSWFRVHNDARIFAVITVSQSLLSIVALAVMLFRAESVYELVVYTLLADCVIIFWLVLRITMVYGWDAPDFSILPPLLKFGIPLVPAGYAAWGLNSMDRLFLVRYSTLEDIGIYTVAYSLGFIIIPLLANPFWTMYPNLAAKLYNQGDLKGIQRLFEYSAGTMLALTVPAMVGLFILGKPILNILATEEFLRGAPLIVFVSSGYIFLFMASYYDISLGLAHRQYYTTVSIITACGVNFILNLLLIPTYNILGAAVATSVSFFIQLGLSSFFASRHRIITAKFSFVGKVIISSVIMGVSVFGLNIYFPDFFYQGVFKISVITLAGILIYVLCLYIFKVLTKEMLKALAELRNWNKKAETIG